MSAHSKCQRRDAEGLRDEASTDHRYGNLQGRELSELTGRSWNIMNEPMKRPEDGPVSFFGSSDHPDPVLVAGGDRF